VYLTCFACFYQFKSIFVGGGGGGGVRIASRQPFVRRRDRQEEVGLGAEGLRVYI